MTVTRLAISLDEELARRIRAAAGDQPISTWLADAAQRKLRAQGLARTVADWERAHGAVTDAERAAVERAWRRPQKR